MQVADSDVRRCYTENNAPRLRRKAGGNLTPLQLSTAAQGRRPPKASACAMRLANGGIQHPAPHVQAGSPHRSARMHAGPLESTARLDGGPLGVGQKVAAGLHQEGRHQQRHARDPCARTGAQNRLKFCDALPVHKRNAGSYTQARPGCIHERQWLLQGAACSKCGADDACCSPQARETCRTQEGLPVRGLPQPTLTSLRSAEVRRGAHPWPEPHPPGPGPPLTPRTACKHAGSGTAAG